jgi:hypothetical protein
MVKEFISQADSAAIDSRKMIDWSRGPQPYMAPSHNWSLISLPFILSLSEIGNGMPCRKICTL